VTFTTAERDLLRRALDVSVNQAPPPPDWGSWDAAHLTPHRRRLGGPAIAVVAAIAVIVIGSATALLRATSPDSPTAPGSVETWEDWYQAAAARSIPVEGDPTLLQGALGPEPRFDTSALGIEQVLEPVDNGPDAVPWQAIVAGHETQQLSDRLVLVGEVGSSFANAPVRTAVAVVEADHEGSAGTEPTVCLLIAQNDQDDWASVLTCRPRLSRTFSDDAGTSTMFVWFHTRYDVLAVTAPSDTAVVALESPAARLWQRPRGGVALFNVDTTRPATITFYGASGAELGRTATIPGTG